MNKLKILVLTTTFPRYENDILPRFVYDLSLGIAKKGNEVYVIAPHAHKSQLKEKIQDIFVYRFVYFFPKKYQKLAYHGGILQSSNKGVLNRIQIPLLFTKELFASLILIKKKKIDIIHSHWIIPSGLIGALCKKITGTKHIATLHAGGIIALNNMKFNKIIGNFIIKNSDHITVVSSYIKDCLKQSISPNLTKYLDKKTSIIPMGVNLNQFNKKNKQELKKIYNLEDKFILLFFGRLAEKKGISYLIKAVPELIRKDINTTLIICGDGPEKENLVDLVKNLNISNNVIFTGFVNNEDKINYFCLADILIIPSIKTKQGDTEGLPVVVMEGMAACLPVVATDSGGTCDAIKNLKTGILIKSKSTEQIKEAILLIKNDFELKNKISKSGYEFAKNNLSWDIITEKFYNVIKNVGGIEHKK